MNQRQHQNHQQRQNRQQNQHQPARTAHERSDRTVTATVTATATSFPVWFEPCPPCRRLRLRMRLLSETIETIVATVTGYRPLLRPWSIACSGRRPGGHGVPPVLPLPWRGWRRRWTVTWTTTSAQIPEAATTATATALPPRHRPPRSTPHPNWRYASGSSSSRWWKSADERSWNCSVAIESSRSDASWSSSDSGGSASSSSSSSANWDDPSPRSPRSRTRRWDQEWSASARTRVAVW